MIRRLMSAHGAARLAALLACALLGACAADRDPPPGEPSMYRSMAAADMTVLDAPAAASMISGYRANNGLPAVTVDPDLMKLADAQARAMASHDKLDQAIRN